MKKFRCPKCGEKIRKKWLFFSSPYQNYICPKCGEKLEWATMKRTLRFLGLCFGVFIVTLTKDTWSTQNMFINGVIMAAIVLLTSGIFSIVSLFLPHAICMEEDFGKKNGSNGGSGN